MDKKDEKLLKKIGKLLSMYGVIEEEKTKFLADVQDAKYDDQEETEETEEEVKETEVVDGNGEAPQEEEPPKEPATEETETPTEEKGDEVPPAEEGEKVEEEQKAEETVEETVEEPAPEQPVDSQPIDNGKYEEMEKALDGLRAKVDSLMEALTKSGVLVNAPQQPVGLEHNDPMGEEVVAGESDILRRLNR